MTTRAYKSTDTGAPVLTGQNSKLVDALLAVLVNGYNSQTVTSITRSGSVATVTKTAHGYNADQRIVHSGAGESEYNIDTAITVVDANTYTYTVAGTPATPATGTITAKVAGAGWTQPYSATNKGVFRTSASTGTGFYLNVQDNGPGGAGACEARIRGYEVMTAQDTGTDPFPTVVQMTNGLFVRKSATADATARPWFVLADETVLYMFVDTGDTGIINPTRAYGWMFGDIFSYKASDAYRCMIAGRTTEATGGAGADFLGELAAMATGSALTTTTPGHYIARGVVGTGGSVNVGKHTNHYLLGALGNSTSPVGGVYASTATRPMAYPNAADSGLYMAPLYIHHSGTLRGYLKGLWAPMHDTPMGHMDAFSGSGLASGKSFRALNVTQYYPSFAATVAAQVIAETSDTWS